MSSSEALLLIDLQNDFCPGGALAVPAGEAVIGVANRLIDRFDLVVATQDWHPLDHSSFAVNHPEHEVGEIIELDGHSQILWPVHCVQNTPGADFHPDLDIRRIHQVFHKGTDSKVDSYSGFFDNRRRRGTGLSEYLESQRVDRLVILGLATDYCVKFSVLDALELGFGVSVVREGCRGVELNSGDIDQAWQEMADAGARWVSGKELG